jgi:uncharacterized protein (DUF433 family)
MVLVVSAEPMPLRTDEDGVVRVGKTRVPLDTMVAVFEGGASPEEIVQQFPALDLADVYAVIGYYLHHREEVAAYLRERAERAQAVRQATEARYDTVGIRARLLARRMPRG